MSYFVSPVISKESNCSNRNGQGKQCVEEDRWHDKVKNIGELVRHIKLSSLENPMKSDG